jgi:hypothetical protein
MGFELQNSCSAALTTDSPNSHDRWRKAPLGCLSPIRNMSVRRVNVCHYHVGDIKHYHHYITMFEYNLNILILVNAYMRARTRTVDRSVFLKATITPVRCRQNAHPENSA